LTDNVKTNVGWIIKFTYLSTPSSVSKDHPVFIEVEILDENVCVVAFNPYCSG